MASILVVDDERDICELLQVNLELDGHAVAVAHDGNAGLSAVLRDRPDLVVLDVMMPGRDGFSVLEVLKASPATARIPVLMLTARADAVDRVRGGIEGAVRYLTKPFSVSGLRQAVREVLAGEEPVMRRRAQTAALEHLARLEAGRGSEAAPAARPRLTRYEPAGARPATTEPPAPPPAAGHRPALTAKQGRLLDAAVAAPDLRSAAEQLGLSRSYLYASLGRIARKLGAVSGPDLVRELRQAELRRARLAPRDR